MALRGGFVLVTERGSDGKPKLGGKSQVLDYYCRKHTRVCRSTFTAELHNLIDICNQALIVRSMLVELEIGPTSPSRLAEIVDTGQHMISVEGVVDAKAVYDAVTADVVKTPDDKHLLFHARAMREFLEAGHVDRLCWFGTDDMLPDGLTKGSIEREAFIRCCQEGVFSIAHRDGSCMTSLTAQVNSVALNSADSSDYSQR